MGDDPRYFQLDKFHPYSEIRKYAYGLAAWYPDIVLVQVLGHTYEGRDLIAVQIGTRRAGKKKIWIDAGIHAQEWIAPATALCLIKKIASNYNVDPSIRNMVDEIDWYIVPVANPDGYEYSWTTERHWRKSRSKQGKCYGVDLNRNWTYHWGEAASSGYPDSEVYGGTCAFSEPETRSLATMITKLGPNLKGYISLHSYGQQWLIPYGYAHHTFPSDYKELVELAEKANAALHRVHGTIYEVKNTAQLYAVSGSSADWVKGVAGVKREAFFETDGLMALLLNEGTNELTSVWAGFYFLVFHSLTMGT